LLRWVQWIEDSLFEERLERQVNLGRVHVLRQHSRAHLLDNLDIDHAQLDIVELDH
jgi:hypothetical protein